MSFIGTWHIYEMETWDEDYFNMDVQAYITIEKNYGGEFQFGLVSGGIDGELAELFPLSIQKKICNPKVVPPALRQVFSADKIALYCDLKGYFSKKILTSQMFIWEYYLSVP